MTSGNTKGTETSPRRWRTLYSIHLGCLLAAFFVVIDGMNNWWSQREILGLRGLNYGLLMSDVDAFENFKQDLAIQYEGRAVFPIVTAVESSLLKEQFPDYLFLKVLTTSRFFSIRSSRSHREEIWAISRQGGPNWRFRYSVLHFDQVVALLGSTGKRIRTIEDAEIVRRVFVELGGAGSFADPAEGPHTRVNESLWHIAGSRSLDGKLAILEIYLGPDEVVESGRLISK